MAKTEDELRQLCAMAYPTFAEEVAKLDDEDADNGEEGERAEELPKWEELSEEDQKPWLLFAEKILEKQDHTIYRDTAINRGFPS